MGTIIGGTDMNSAGCWKFANWQHWAPYLQVGISYLEDIGLVPAGSSTIHEHEDHTVDLGVTTAS